MHSILAVLFSVTKSYSTHAITIIFQEELQLAVRLTISLDKIEEAALLLSVNLYI